MLALETLLASSSVNNQNSHRSRQSTCNGLLTVCLTWTIEVTLQHVTCELRY
jgi:hypothetical protein